MFNAFVFAKTQEHIPVPSKVHERKTEQLPVLPTFISLCSGHPYKKYFGHMTGLEYLNFVLGRTVLTRFYFWSDYNFCSSEAIFKEKNKLPFCYFS